jgi:chromosome segregation ATPase
MANDSRHTELRELEALRETVNDQLEHIDSLQGRNDALAAQVAELRELLDDANENLSLRDEDLQRRETELLTRRSEELMARDDEIRWLRDVVADLQAHADSSAPRLTSALGSFMSRLNAQLRWGK